MLNDRTRYVVSNGPIEKLWSSSKSDVKRAYRRGWMSSVSNLENISGNTYPTKPEKIKVHFDFVLRRAITPGGGLLLSKAIFRAAHCQVSINPLWDRISNHFTREKIKNHRQIDKFIGDPNIRDVRCSYLVNPINSHLLQKVRIEQAVMIWVGHHHKLIPGFSMKLKTSSYYDEVLSRQY